MELEQAAEMKNMDDWSKFTQTLSNFDKEKALLEEFIKELN
jgi:hypothetical protein